jgi:nucleoside 2-deoxyribosyltransferase
MMIVYFAGPLFTPGEQRWNAQVAAGLRSLGLEVILPQETAAALTQGGNAFDAAAIFAANVAGIDRCDVVVAVLDGADPDSGTCWECGYAFQSSKPIIGVRTDFRRAGDDPGAPVNLMLSQSCAALIVLPMERWTEDEWLWQQIAQAVQESQMRPAA